MGEKYFKWLLDFICDGRHSESVSYERLLRFLHSVAFKYVHPNDSNRYEDGVDLRYRFSFDTNLNYDIVKKRLYGPCSVLEMLIALSLRCEETIMDDTRYGNRTGQWFWQMINTLGLGAMTDDRFDWDRADEIIYRFLERDYEPDGSGGLFKLRHRDCDVRDISIWSQMCRYLDEI